MKLYTRCMIQEMTIIWDFLQVCEQVQTLKLAMSSGREVTVMQWFGYGICYCGPPAARKANVMHCLLHLKHTPLLVI